jgi:hypothetical protein
VAGLRAAVVRLAAGLRAGALRVVVRVLPVVLAMVLVVPLGAKESDLFSGGRVERTTEHLFVNRRGAVVTARCDGTFPSTPVRPVTRL